jgi:uncharacterized membrane protein
MNWISALFLVSFFTGLSFLIVALISSKWPPREINMLYGYRSRRARKSQEAWDFAQQFGNRRMFEIAFVQMAVGVMGLWIPLDQIVGLVISIVLMTLCLIYLMATTEKELKRRFGE